MKFLVRVFGAISTTQSLYETNDLPTLLESSVHNGEVHVVGKQGICCDHDVTAWYENAYRLFCEACEERTQRGNVGFIQNRESWKRASLATVEGRGNAPDSPAPVAQFRLLDVRVFFEAVGRVCHNRMDRIFFSCLKPFESICEVG